MEYIKHNLFKNNNNFIKIDNKKKEAFRILGVLRKEFDFDSTYKNFFSFIPILYRKILIQDGIIDDIDGQIDEKTKFYIFDKSDYILKQELFGILIDYLDSMGTVAKLYYLIG